MLMSPDRFLGTLFRNAPKGFRVLFMVKKDGQVKGAGRHAPGSDLTNILDKINRAEADGYFHCGVDLAQTRTVRCRAVDVDGVCFLWVDIDREMPQTELLSIEKDEFSPTVVVRSGRGYHLYWLLNRFERDKIAVTEANRWLSKRFGGDNVADVSRVLRLPGTFNWKDRENPKPVEVVWLDCDHGGFPRERDLGSFGRVEGRSLTDLGPEPKILSVEHLLDELSEELCEMLTSRIGVTDRSARDLKLANRLAAQGYGLDIIFSVLVHPTWASGDKGRDNHKYARTQAANALRESGGQQSLLQSIRRAFSGVGRVVDPNRGREPREGRATTTVASRPRGTEQRQVVAAGGESDEEGEPAAAAVDLGPFAALRRDIMLIHADVLQVDGTVRGGNRNSPQLGGEFGRRVAQAFRDNGFRFVRDVEHEKNYIADRTGMVCEAEGKGYARLIKDVTGFAEGQKEFSYIAGGIASFIESYGERIKVGRWAHYDAETSTYYFLANDETGLIYSIDETGALGTLFNGDGDVFLRPRLQPARPLELSTDVSEREGVLLLEQCFTRFIAGDEATKRLLTCFTLASVLCYGSPVMTFPLLHLTGPSGKGKSHTLGLITSLLFGYYQLLTYTTAAAFRVVATETLVAIDDKEELSSSLEEYCLLASTAATRGICKTEDQQGVVLQKTHVINAITSIEALRTVPLRRRALVIEINKELYPSEEVLKSKGITNITNNRSRIWSGLIPLIGRVAASFRNGDFDGMSDRVYDAIPVDDFKGQTDFMALMLIIERELHRAVGRPFDEEASLNSFMEVCRINDALEVMGRDPLVLSLESFFERLFEEKTSEMYDIGDVPGSTVKLVTIHRMDTMTWALTTTEENAKIQDEIGSPVRGIKATATGWVSIFAKDTSVFGRSIKSPSSLGVQFRRLLGKKDFPFIIKKGRARGIGKYWCVYQKIG